MSPTYEHFFWTVAIDNADTGAEPVDIGVAKRAQLRKAAVDLNSIPSILFATAEGGTAAVHPEICLLLSVDEHDTVNEYATHIAKALATHGLDAKLTLQEETRFYEFGEAEVKCVRECQCIPSGEEEKAKIYRLIESAETLPPLPEPNDVDDSPNGNNTGGISALGNMFASAGVLVSGSFGNTANIAAQQRGPAPFTITAEKYEELKNSRGDDLRYVLKKLYRTIYGLRDELKNSIVMAELASVGVVTVGVAMHDFYQRLVRAAIAGGTAHTTGRALAFSTAAALTVGGPATLGVVITPAGMTAAFLMKDATNVLLVVNDSEYDLTFRDDDVTSGQRCSVVTTIPARASGHSKLGYPTLYPCGAFVYQKKLGSWYGSLFGVEFGARRRAWTDRVSIGMDSPNTALGGSNSIFVTGNDAKKAMAGARDGNAEDDSANTPRGRITGRRAHKWGPINFGFAFYKATVP
ncbi:hypothetical protein BV22DRAFT_1041727 [Leucogyrophana mollusca]|uniref:Uncharacterized protein n=1 Tax=Leucogyrophana mollusca TaxID=85980 RepID=A0ACB8AZV6_9AGAM|nr:hypothetical protein BV22DRAFT_1041727 [Leucogyrophana mollusca]